MFFVVLLCQMVAVYRDPKGEDVDSGTPHQYTVTTQDERELEGLRQRLKHLQDTLKHHGSEVAKQQCICSSTIFFSSANYLLPKKLLPFQLQNVLAKESNCSK